MAKNTSWLAALSVFIGALVGAYLGCGFGVWLGVLILCLPGRPIDLLDWFGRVLVIMSGLGMVAGMVLGWRAACKTS